MKIFKKIVLGISFILFTTGCMKANVEMSINKDKSMKVSLVSAISDEVMNMAGEYGSDASSSLISDEEKEKYKELGFSVEDYKESGYTGARVVKSIKNIDEISSTETANDSLKNMFEENAQKQYYFVVKKGFFKNTYKAVFKSSEFSDDVDSMNQYSDMDSSELGMDSEELKKLMSSMEVKFVLTLPDKAISNNADEVSSDGKTLSWDFLKDSPKETIEFEFTLVNKGATYASMATVALLVLLVIITFITTQKPKTTNPIKVEKDNLESNDLGEVDLTGTSMDNKIKENMSM